MSNSKHAHLINVVRFDENGYEYVETKVIEMDRDIDRPMMTSSTHTINVWSGLA